MDMNSCILKVKNMKHACLHMRGYRMKKEAWPETEYYTEERLISASCFFALHQAKRRGACSVSWQYEKSPGTPTKGQPCTRQTRGCALSTQRPLYNACQVRTVKRIKRPRRRECSERPHERRRLLGARAKISRPRFSGSRSKSARGSFSLPCYVSLSISSKNPGLSCATRKWVRVS